MSQSLSGSEFTRRVESALGQALGNEELVAVLYETCRNEGLSTSFRDLALYAKSFQKVTRLLSDARTGDDTKKTAEGELAGLIKKFSDLVGIITSRLPLEKQNDIRANFLLTTPESFGNLQSLLNDFVRVKDYLLNERDRRDRS